ncbi:cytochrome c-type biogenesis protein [Actinokineospora diospyrosa]|uniref:Cytochrome c-type biogenesis protein n=1 Tax=Actinokineospora diospyrosa TaxID=103728 RepID=A0ABT1IHM2_9PSEU|nr:cytochrome c-type biogenesis protein [Actinokineospora diospyrosa]
MTRVLAQATPGRAPEALPYADRVDPTQVAVSGPLLVAAGLSLLAGLLSFASPCVVPLVPGYLAYLAALVGAEAPAVSDQEERKKGRYRVVGAVGLFVLGFTVVFAATVGSVVWLADALLINEDVLQRVGGVVTIAMALVFIGLIPGLQKDIRIHKTPRFGLAGAPVLGGIFALGWTPCLSPTLSGVMSIAASTGGSAVRGYLLVIIYCLGLGIPFLVIALGARWAVRATTWLRAHTRGVQLFGGALLLAVGVLLVTGLWADVVSWLRNTVVSDFELPL